MERFFDQSRMKVRLKLISYKVERGTAEMLGAIFVVPFHKSTIKRCIIKDMKTSLWGRCTDEKD